MMPATNTNGSVAKAWLRAIEKTAPIARNPDRVFFTVIDELALRRGDAPALLSARESLSYRELVERTNRYARFALDRGLGKGDVVCLLMPNRPEYMAIWLGITRIGAVVALLNTNLTGPALAHCINIVTPKMVIVDAECLDALSTALPGLTVSATIWVYGIDASTVHSLDCDVAGYSGATLSDAERRNVTIEDLALHIYTSGTTGAPKAVNVSHARVMQWTHWFAGMMDTRPQDRMYDCLPMYHSAGGVLAPGAILVGGGSVVIRDKFSASQFWSDIVRWDCTLFQYIGELCRYLLHSPCSPNEAVHQLRMACGNGLRPDIWKEVKTRFRIPQIFEFYAATEGGVSLFNVEGEHGAIGRVPSYLSHRFSPALLRLDIDTEEPVRDERSFCVRCAPDEVGEAIGEILNEPSNIGSRFEGYGSPEASAKKILRDVFKPGDAWVRTGDLMRKDRNGFFYFVDRIGDTFRWKGENVSTFEVTEAICAFPGIQEANVYGVTVPCSDGRAGMAALVTESDFDLPGFRQHLVSRLPHYARPLFLRIRNEMEVTGTFKHRKTDLVRQGYDPASASDTVYFNDPQTEAFVQLGQHLFQRIQTGAIRL